MNRKQEKFRTALFKFLFYCREVKLGFVLQTAHFNFLHGYWSTATWRNPEDDTVQFSGRTFIFCRQYTKERSSLDQAQISWNPKRRAYQIDHSQMTWTCDFCGRKFLNRKALRGHIRVHNQAMKNNGSVAFRIMDRLKQRCNLRQDMNLGRDAVSVLSRPKSSQNWVQHICRICNRPFLSEKSLFRHMR